MRNYTSLSEIQKDLQGGSVSCVSLVDNYLQRIEEKKNLHAFLEVFPDSARAKAKEVDARIASGKAGKLAGMVIALKDNICY
ncbi:MAG TPA: amidase family protein, partial [Bacteroidia bacterium]|nr:amidase family protein [Bacteroidia bacterium]